MKNIYKELIEFIISDICNRGFRGGIKPEPLILPNTYPHNERLQLLHEVNEYIESKYDPCGLVVMSTYTDDSGSIEYDAVSQDKSDDFVIFSFESEE